jgi:hypothetical protein
MLTIRQKTGLFPLAVAPAVNAQGTHGAFAVRLGIGMPLDNNLRDWKNVDAISRFS